MPVETYVNGRYVSHAEAVVHIEDRGYQFADAVYEVIAVTGGEIIDEVLHMQRLFRSLRELNMAVPMGARSMGLVLREILRRNRVREGALYLQVSRGVAPRNHAWPSEIKPTMVVSTRAMKWPKSFADVMPITIITVADERWSRPDIKTVGLLPNSLARMQADAAGAEDTWMVDKNDQITEGSSANAWIVTEGGELVTRQLSHAILAGVTRQAIMAFANNAGLVIAERAFSVVEAKAAREAFQTSTTALVKPVVKIDGATISGGKPGHVTERVFEAYLTHFQSFGEGL
ncbi:MAG: D-amino-acid transaminase [Pseudomonadota bacterium]|nr:D-amino-acid transaminase [Pseudomonadota bacterium]